MSKFAEYFWMNGIVKMMKHPVISAHWNLEYNDIRINIKIK